MDAERDSNTQRWLLVRDATAFQLKLAIDGVRDLLLIPVSLVAALISLVTGGGRTSTFYEVVRLGQRTERWINLFGIVRDDHDHSDEGMDAFVQRLELLVLEQYRRGGITATAKDRIDQVLDRVAGGNQFPDDDTR